MICRGSFHKFEKALHSVILGLETGLVKEKKNLSFNVHVVWRHVSKLRSHKFDLMEPLVQETTKSVTNLTDLDSMR